MSEFFQTVGGWVVSVLLGAVAIYTWVLTRNATIYANFDAMYQKILDIGLERPELRDPTKTAKYREYFKEDDIIRYETYAYMVFNICETIADSLDLYPECSNQLLARLEYCFCRFLPSTADRRWLKETWEPVLVFERDLHSGWLADQTGGVRFKQKFLDLLRNL
jgi:hypothetical protein